jgi:aminotransferase
MPPAPHPLRLSARVTALKTPATFAITAKAKALARQGADIISFGLGEPDFDTPAPIRQAAADAMNSGQTHYMPTLGDPETRTVIAEKLTRVNGIAGLTADHIAISAGAKHSYYLVCQCLLDPGGAGEGRPNEVLLPVPSWVSYAPMAELAGGRVKTLSTTAANNFKISPDQLRAAITPQSRLLVLNTPSNPCGTMYSEPELRALARVVADAAKSTAPGLVIVTDEIYEKIVFGGIPHFSIGSIPEVAERTVTINGLSKTYSVTGWRVGWTIAPALLTDAIRKVHDFLTVGAAAPLQEAGALALELPASYYTSLADGYVRRRDRLVPILERAGFRVYRPSGAYYAMTEIGGLGWDDDVAFARHLVEKVGVAVVPGSSFYNDPRDGRGQVRFAFCKKDATLDEAERRLTAAGVHKS